MPSFTNFRRQSQETPLNDDARRALADLLQTKASSKRLDEHLERAAQLLTDVASQVNDRARMKKENYAVRQRKLQQKGEAEDEEERQGHEKFQEKVKSLTERMDQSIRAVIDEQIWAEGIPDALKHVATKAKPRTVRQDTSDQDTEEESNEQPDASEQPTTLLHVALSTQETTWKSKPLTERYTTNNNYVGWYAAVYESQNPDGPPMPHSSLWFADEEGREVPTSRTEHGNEDEDSDLEVASERVRITCPLTLRTMKDPVTSNKCRHSFEKDAILELLQESQDHVPFTSEQQAQLNHIPQRERLRRNQLEKQFWIPQVRCPECSAILRREDLSPNPVLLRKIKRHVEADQKRNATDSDEEEEDDEVPRGTQRKPVGLGSSPVVKNRRKTIVKPETVPETQLSM